MATHVYSRISFPWEDGKIKTRTEQRTIHLGHPNDVVHSFLGQGINSEILEADAIARLRAGGSETFIHKHSDDGNYVLHYSHTGCTLFCYDFHEDDEWANCAQTIDLDAEVAA